MSFGWKLALALGLVTLAGSSAAPPARAAIEVGKFDVSARLGVNISVITEFAKTAQERKYSPYAGVLFAYGVSEWVAIETGAFYSGKGGEGPALDTDGDPAMLVTGLSYFTVPLRVRLPLGAGSTAPYFAFGGEFAWLTSAEQWYSTDESATTDVSAAFEDFDFSTIAAVGLEIPVRRVIVIVEGGWTRGLTDILKSSSVEGKNSTMQLVGGLTYRF